LDCDGGIFDSKIRITQPIHKSALYKNKKMVNLMHRVRVYYASEEAIRLKNGLGL